MNTNFTKRLCSQIRILRKNYGLTQEQLAERLGVSYQAVSKWENEQTCPDIALVPLIAEVFRVSIDELFGRRMVLANLYSGLIAEYLFQGDAQDSSGKEHHGTVVGATPCADRFGIPDSAYLFDGKDDYIVIEKAPQLNRDAFSISVWCCFDRDAKLEGWNSAIVSQDGHFNNRVFQLSTYNANMTFHLFLKGADLQMNSTIHKDYWYHIVVTYENDTFKLYKNGILISESKGTLTPCDEEPLFIGRKSTDEPYFFFMGKIDDIRIYERALVEEEINALFLENNWIPVKEPVALETDVIDAPIIQCVENVQLLLPKKDIKVAAEWYIKHLGFKLLFEQQEFYILSLYNGPNLYLHSNMSDTDNKGSFPSFVYSTKLSPNQLEEHLITAGIAKVDISDEGFAYFISFRDPFGQSWVIKRYKHL